MGAMSKILKSCINGILIGQCQDGSDDKIHVLTEEGSVRVGMMSKLKLIIIMII
jgi:hypothetical protein